MTDFDKVLERLRREHGLPPRASKSNPRHDEGSGPRIKRAPRLKRLSAKARLSDNPKARAAAEAFRDAMSKP